MDTYNMALILLFEIFNFKLCSFKNIFFFLLFTNSSRRFKYSNKITYSNLYGHHLLPYPCTVYSEKLIYSKLNNTSFSTD